MKSKKLLIVVLGSLAVLVLSLPAFAQSSAASSTTTTTQNSASCSDREDHHHYYAGPGMDHTGRDHSDHPSSGYAGRPAGEAD